MSGSKVIHGFVVTRAEGLTDEQRENNRRWVEALRSGAYEQTREQLHRNGAYCCLGVAERVMGGALRGENLVRGDEEMFAVLSNASCSDLGIDNDCGLSVECNGLVYNLADLNDEKGLSFAQIADIIEFWASLSEGEGQ